MSTLTGTDHRPSTVNRQRVATRPSAVHCRLYTSTLNHPLSIVNASTHNHPLSTLDTRHSYRYINRPFPLHGQVSQLVTPQLLQPKTRRSLTSSADAVVRRTHRATPCSVWASSLHPGQFSYVSLSSFPLYFYSLLYTLLFYFSFLPSYIYCRLTPVHARNEGRPHADGEEITDQYVQWYATAAENAVLRVGFNSTYYYFFLYGRHRSRTTTRPHRCPRRQCRALTVDTLLQSDPLDKHACATTRVFFLTPGNSVSTTCLTLAPPPPPNSASTI